jgi:aminotransferase
VLADPVNPTGGIYASEELEQIAWWAKKYDVLIYLDDSFGAYRYESEETRLIALPNTENRLLIAGSVSKSHGLNAARVGWLLGCRHLLRPCAATASMAAPFVSSLCQQIAVAALRSGAEAATKIRDEFAGRRRYLVESLQGMGLPPANPAGGYFCWAPVSSWGLTGREFAKQLLLSQRVLVNPGEPFGPSGEDCIRVSYATEEGRLREGLQRLATFMDELRKTNVETPPRLNWKGARPTGGHLSDEQVQQNTFGPETQSRDV